MSAAWNPTSIGSGTTVVLAAGNGKVGPFAPLAPGHALLPVVWVSAGLGLGQAFGFSGDIPGADMSYGWRAEVAGMMLEFLNDTGSNITVDWVVLDISP